MPFATCRTGASSATSGSALGAAAGLLSATGAAFAAAFFRLATFFWPLVSIAALEPCLVVYVSSGGFSLDSESSERCTSLAIDASRLAGRCGLRAFFRPVLSVRSHAPKGWRVWLMLASLGLHPGQRLARLLPQRFDLGWTQARCAWQGSGLRMQ